MGLAVQVCATSHLAIGAMPCLLGLNRTNVTSGMVYQSLQHCTCFYQHDSIACYAKVLVLLAYECLSVCLSHAGIVSKRKKLGSQFFHRRRARTLFFKNIRLITKFERGHPRTRGINFAYIAGMQPCIATVYGCRRYT